MASQTPKATTETYLHTSASFFHPHIIQELTSIFLHCKMNYFWYYTSLLKNQVGRLLVDIIHPIHNFG